ncbi:hypothetical protein FRC11_014028, partial [Ceratobasidium sp. 423]
MAGTTLFADLQSMTAPERTDMSMHDGLSSSHITSSDDPLSTIYPSLAPPPLQWKQDLKDLIALLNRNYISDSSTELAQEMCKRLPSLLDSAVQSISRVTGVYINTRAVYFNYKDLSTVNAFCTVTDSIKEAVDKETLRKE